MKNNKEGFTLIELMVVILITALLSALTIVYSHTGQNEVTLSIESSKISQLILQAKELSIATYSAGANTCAYGVHIDYTNQDYSLFAYDSATSSGGSGPIYCPTYASTTADGVILADMQPYGTGATYNIHISSGVVLVSSSAANDVLTDVLFFPPSPFTLISRDDATFMNPAQSSKIYLKTIEGNNNGTISVSPAGQVGY
jgi:prepilin-type N-terminal cleavage/methylation domain-containing protein